MYLVPSVVYGGCRVRPIYNTIYPRPLNETFHEFLICITQSTLGESWWKQQSGMKLSDQHIILQWAHAYSEFTKHGVEEQKLRPEDGVYRARAAGPVWALLSLGFDLYCLQTKNVLPDFLVARLRDHSSFQSARYEIAVAAIMARSGYEITFLDNTIHEAKHCEFIALHSASGIKVGVEAKSRVRPGVYHARGDFSYVEDQRGIERLLRKARKQKPVDLPFFIFVDMNLPPSPNLPIEKTSWFKDFRAATDKFQAPSEESPDPFNAIFATNMAHHYGSLKTGAVPSEWAYVLPIHVETPLKNQELINAVVQGLQEYDYIPFEV